MSYGPETNQNSSGLGRGAAGEEHRFVSRARSTLARSASRAVNGKATRKLFNLAFTTFSSAVGGTFFDLLNEMRRAQWMSKDEVNARSEARLGMLLKHSAENVPFYRDLYQRLGIAPDELGTVADLAALPILTKSDYRKLQAADFNAGNIEPYFLIQRTTSGSTGEPFSFSLDRRALPVIFASHLFYDSWHGLHPIDKCLRITAPPALPNSLPANTPATVRLEQAITNRIQGLYEALTQERISLWEIDSERARTIWRRIEAFQPKFVMGYTSALAAIADHLLRHNLRLSQPIKGLITIAETLSPGRRSLLEEYFNAPITNRYGLREFGSWSAQSCHESPNQFHINTELVVCEVLREDGTSCALGEKGRVVLTDLHNYARPFIRYDTGDLAIADTRECACGRAFPLLGPIEGRSLECVKTPSGREVSPVVLGHYLFVYQDHVEAVRDYQLIQHAANRVRLLIIPANGWTERHRNELQIALLRLLNDEMEVEVVTVPEIPIESSGKRPIIKVIPEKDSMNSA